ncbi:hypothetical protein PoB_005268100 [Plakobranchus ocellatus]|uniref:Uncharacterized protein n=1 Tax=Plakobranchus ocellatus TaxID=259542 RepID=A0AAV4C455_9GAST|nr:hypothetical protein PoB_005268100 [Plakobranchus ocellatus]
MNKLVAHSDETKHMILTTRQKHLRLPPLQDSILINGLSLIKTEGLLITFNFESEKNLRCDVIVLRRSSLSTHYPATDQQKSMKFLTNLNIPNRIMLDENLMNIHSINAKLYASADERICPSVG